MQYPKQTKSSDSKMADVPNSKNAMKVGLPVWAGRVSPVFDSAKTLLVVTYEAGREVSRSQSELEGGWMPVRVSQVVGLGIETLLCGAISRSLMNMLTAADIHVIPFIRGSEEDVLAAFQAGALDAPEFNMPGCCRGQQRKRNRQRNRRNRKDGE